MALTYKLPTLDGLPADIAALYKADGDAFVLAVDGLPSGGGEDSSALERSLRAARKEREDAIARAKAAEAALADATKKLEALEASGKQTDEKVAAMLTKWEADKKAAVEAAVKEVEGRYAPLAEKVTRYELDNVLQAAFLKSGGLKQHVQRALTLAKTDGWTLVDGKPVRRGADGEVTTTTPDDYFGKAFKTEVPEWFEGSRAGGGNAGGAERGAAAGGRAPSADPTKWSSDERRAYIEENGPAAYRKLLDDYMVAGPPKTP